MKYLSVPCPICEGLVDRDTVTCSRCGVSWESVLRMCGEGVSKTEGFIVRLAESDRWKTESAVTLLQETIDNFTLVDRYYQQMERELR